ncbi:MAG: thioesterase family protein [Parcubacteria group bacterium]
MAGKETIYRPEGSRFVPQAVASSAWDRMSQSGIAMSALLTHAAEQTPAPAPLQLARVTMDILRPAPMRTLEVSTRVLREGRRMQVVEATAAIDGADVARLRALRVRTEDTPAVPLEAADYGPPEQAPDRSLGRQDGGRSALETRVIRGGREELGPGVVWGRPGYPLLPGVAVSPSAAAAMMADVGSGVSNVFDPAEWTFASIDLSVHFARTPISDWILVDARTATFGNGMGLVDTVLSDLQGPFGRAHQTLFIARARPAA